MSSQIQKIVVPMDFSDASERAALYAETLARPLQAALYLVHVLPPPALASSGAASGAVTTPTHERDYQAARRRLEALARRLGAETRQVTTEVRTGETAESIALASIHYGADLVVMATHGRTGMAHLLAGSVAESVIRKAPCPVLVIRESGKAHVHRHVPTSKVA